MTTAWAVGRFIILFIASLRGVVYQHLLLANVFLKSGERAEIWGTYLLFVLFFCFPLRIFTKAFIYPQTVTSKIQNDTEHGRIEE